MIREISIHDLWLIAGGLKWTVFLSLIAFVGGAVIGVLVALMRTSKSRILVGISYAYIEVFQGTPILLQLFVFYYGLPLIGVDVNAVAAGALGLIAHASAYLGEIWRGGIQAVRVGQTEAARALGIPYHYRMLDVVLPQAFKISLPNTVGFLVALIKGTSLVAIIGFTELTRAGQIVSNNTFQPLIVFGIVGALYFCLCYPLSYMSEKLEAKLASGR